MPFAFDEFRELVSKIKSPTSLLDPKLRYVCAVVSELAYYHVPRFEIELHKRAMVIPCKIKRAMVIPCKIYRSIIQHRITTDVMAYLRAGDFMFSFVIVDRGIIAVGILIDKKLFIGLRGSVFLFDWRINLRAPLTQIQIRPGVAIGRFHRGFAEEAVRISIRIIEEVRKWSNAHGSIDEVFVSGHSLGGAVAAVSQNLLISIVQRPVHIITMGAPRYCDAAAYFGNVPYFEYLAYQWSWLTLPTIPTQIRRPGDIVPSVPPRRMGYADPPLEYDTVGEPFTHSHIRDYMSYYFLWRATLFTLKCSEPHDKEMYRKELGKTCGSHNWDYDLIDYEPLIRKDVR